MDTRFVRPAPGLDDPEVVRHIRDPRTGRVLPREGDTVEWSDFWERRKADDDLEFGPLPETPAETKGRAKPATPETKD